LAYQPVANSIFISEQTSHQQPANSTSLSEQTSTSHQPKEQAECCLKMGSLEEFTEVYWTLLTFSKF
jgi:hypothetical protein